jgi:2-polyprenyl-3-methyl-5-hydroxy-6-metoxy-1,4-benzoquinol methylase
MSMTSSDLLIGKQERGVSPDFTKQMAMDALKFVEGDIGHSLAVDVGGGSGDLARKLVHHFDQVALLDFNADSAGSDLSQIKPVQCDLNNAWPLADGTCDFAFATEVIEHVENPRHFFREMSRIVKGGGYIFVTTPNLHSLFSKLTFVLRGQHRYFQDASYPAHITALCLVDLKRIGQELSLSEKLVLWSGKDRIPIFGWKFPLNGSFFSVSVGVLYKKERTRER